MIREAKFNDKDTVADIKLDSGTVFTRVDIPPDPFYQEGMVCFWDDQDSMVFVPLTEVKWVRIKVRQETDDE